MVYPVVVIFVAVAILTFIMVAIIPKFEKIFNDFGMKLPWADRRRSSTSRRGSPSTGGRLPLFPIGIWLLDQAHPPEPGRELRPRPDHALDPGHRRRSSRRPIVARTMRTLGTLVSSGVPILEALNIVRETANNAVFERMFQRVLRVHPRGRHHRRAAHARAGSSTTWSST